MAKSAFKKPFVQGAKEFFTGLSGSRKRDENDKIVIEDGQGIFSDRSQNLNIQKLIANFDSGARPNRYDVNLFCSNLNIQMRGIRCVGATLPGRQLESTDFSEYGPTRKFPYNISNDGGEASFTFLCDSNFTDRFIIDAWHSEIFSPNEGNNADLISVNHPMMRYYNEYIGEIYMTQYNLRGNDALRYRLLEAYPVAFASQQLSYDDDNQIMRFECTFAFRSFTTEYVQLDDKTANGLDLNNVLNIGGRYLDLIGKGASLFGEDKIGADAKRYRERLGKLSGFFS